MLKALEKRNLSDCSRWNSIVFFFEADLFECDCLSRDLIYGLVDDTIGAFTEFVELLVAIYLRGRFDELRVLLRSLLSTRQLGVGGLTARSRLCGSGILLLGDVIFHF